MVNLWRIGLAAAGWAVPVVDVWQMPSRFALEQNYPNPFNPSTTISYSLARSSHVNLTVYNMLGQQVATLAQGMESAGHYEVVFDASGLSSGTYFYRLSAGEFTDTKRFVVLK